MPSLFDPIQLGAIETPNRILMAPLTRGRATRDHVPTPRMEAKALAAHNIGFLELREMNAGGTFGATDVPRQSPAIRKVFPGPLVLNQEYDAASAQAALDSGVANAISFGRPFLANPDLPARFAAGAPLNDGVMTTWYAQGDEGYIDYPALEPVDG